MLADDSSAATAARSSGTTTEPEAWSRVVHGTAVFWLGKGLLLRGRSGAGKSDLALRLIEAGAQLVADDLVRLTIANERLIARPAGQGGLIELRGQGIFHLPARPHASLDLCLELGHATPARERLPAPSCIRFGGIRLPCYRLDAAAASATARVRVLLTAERRW
jgi:serine kinase of HPr protein (carbohydrate metabolism regulator)